MGSSNLAEFERAPASVQAAFFAAIGRNADECHRVERPAFELHGVRPRGYHRLIRWDQRWRDRAYRVRLQEARGLPDNGFSAPDAERLKAMPAVDYVEALSGEEVPRSRLIRCPLPEHDDRTPSFHVRATTWKCYGCGRHGTIYDLAAELWDLGLRGGQFIELHRQLMERFG